MTNLKKFYCKSAKIEILMTNLEDNENCLYIVKEEPRKKNAKWHTSTYKFWHSDEANKKFLELVTFWCR